MLSFRLLVVRNKLNRGVSVLLKCHQPLAFGVFLTCNQILFLIEGWWASQKLSSVWVSWFEILVRTPLGCVSLEGFWFWEVLGHQGDGPRGWTRAPCRDYISHLVSSTWVHSFSYCKKGKKKGADQATNNLQAIKSMFSIDRALFLNVDDLLLPYPSGPSGPQLPGDAITHIIGTKHCDNAAVRGSRWETQILMQRRLHSWCCSLMDCLWLPRHSCRYYSSLRYGRRCVVFACLFLFYFSLNTPESNDAAANVNSRWLWDCPPINTQSDEGDKTKQRLECSGSQCNPRSQIISGLWIFHVRGYRSALQWVLSRSLWTRIAEALHQLLRERSGQCLTDWDDVLLEQSTLSLHIFCSWWSRWSSSQWETNTIQPLTTEKHYNTGKCLKIRRLNIIDCRGLLRGNFKSVFRQTLQSWCISALLLHKFKRTVKWPFG